MTVSAVFAIAAVLMGQATAEGTLIPGAVDFPVLGNAEVLEDCGDVSRFNLAPGSQLVCLTTPNHCCHEALLNSYGRLALDRGWRFGLADSPRVHFLRPGQEGRCDMLTLGSTRTSGSTDRFEPYDAFTIVFRPNTRCP